MSPLNRSLSRRGFLKTGMTAAAAGSLAGLDTVRAAQEDARDPVAAQEDDRDPLAAQEDDRDPLAAQDARDPVAAQDAYETLRQAPTPLIMDALSRLGFDRTALAMSRDVRPMIGSKGTIVGPAVTTKYEESDTQTTRDDIRSYVFRPVDEAEPGSIWVTASGTSEILSMFGDVIVLACRRKGLAGMVTDGGCRDIEGMEEVGLPVYAAGICLYGPGSVIRPVAANVPVVCGGIEIAPGDVVAADVNGVMAFPRAALTDVIRVIPELQAKEDRSRRLIEEGQGLETGYVF